MRAGRQGVARRGRWRGRRQVVEYTEEAAEGDPDATAILRRGTVGGLSVDPGHQRTGERVVLAWGDALDDAWHRGGEGRRPGGEEVQLARQQLCAEIPTGEPQQEVVPDGDHEVVPPLPQHRQRPFRQLWSRPTQHAPGSGEVNGDVCQPGL
ncbi:MAG: hypothetical protein ACI8RZ_000234 [Myxococcota bacterium]|jgi:hypothetical protein